MCLHKYTDSPATLTPAIYPGNPLS
jgi:hypothetical protein